MHPVTRIFQILFLVAGTGFAVAALLIYYDDFQQSTTVSGSWTCRVEDHEQRCNVTNLAMNPGNRDEAYVNLAVGAILMIGAGAIAAGGRRRAAPMPGGPAAAHLPPMQGGPVPPPGPGGY